MSLLLVDDSPDNLLPLQLLLQESGHPDVRTATSAAEAFQILGAADPQSTGHGVDVVLLDVRMPGMDGIEACRRLKADTRFRDIPVIMVTAQAEEHSLDAAFRAGATDFVSKPIRPVELLARVGSALALKQERDRRRAREAQLVEVTRQLEDANRALQRLSGLDGLTGIPNRRHFDDRFQRAWRHAVRVAAPLSLVMIDVDFFKHYNDSRGHLAGDDCLRRVVAALRAALHRPRDFVARYGGEEFVAVLPDTDVAGAAVVAEGLRLAVEALAIDHPAACGRRTLTISLGVAGGVPTRDASAQALVAAADMALYRAKQEGRNTVRVGRPEFALPAVPEPSPVAPAGRSQERL